MGFENNMPEGWVDSIFGKLPKDWGVVEIDNIADVTKLAGFEYSEYFEYVEDGEIIALRALNSKNGILDLKNIKRIRKTVSDQLPRSKLIKNDILFTYTGTIGEFALIPENNKYHLAPNVCLIRCNQNFDVYFLYSFFRTSKFKKLVEGFINGSTQETIPMANIRQFSIISPPLPEQKAIAKVLTAFDDKIELLQAQNKTLETMAQTIFKEWFGKYQIGDELPEGWRVGKLGEIANLKSGYAFKSKDFVEESSKKALKIKDLKGDGKVSLNAVSCVTNDVTELSRVQYFKLKEGDIVLAMSGNTTGKIGVIPPHSNEVYLNQRVGKFFMIKQDLNSFLYSFLMSGNYEEKILSMGYGSAQPNISPSQIENIDIIYPNEEMLFSFLNISNPIFNKVLDNNAQIQSLTKTRDTVLPKLMSGQVRINNIKQLASA